MASRRCIFGSGQELTITSPNLHVVEGDATDRAAVSEAMNGGNAVISVLGARGPVMTEATRAIVDAAKQKGPERVVMLSSFAVARDRLTPVTKVVTGIAMRSQIKDKTAGEEVLRSSSLDWTIVYATKLTNGPKTEARVVPESEKVGMSQKISRAGVASFPCKRPRKTSTATAASSSPDDTAVRQIGIRSYRRDEFSANRTPSPLGADLFSVGCVRPRPLCSTTAPRCVV